ncbi:MAG: carbamoyltransferase [gamma proteobacterium symbiont of Bathyaustriella thionipta]|nr:carbamoyltransferase [gamma proteobacterium symbiont of Bathyaustriella thionipta]MCU7952618.1 carbamoyltransferase [gamma proteobacterium symbiont of Bathyaustriella thionipta]MCU7955115.1 carbamoyltransferase [gamma proteobacterium symbiont of Bathyaustriella thionipta]
MPLITLGLSGSLNHDPSAALFIDGKLVAAAEEERFLRDKHAKGKMPLEATRFCLEYAGITPEQIDIVAVPYAEIDLSTAARWHYAKRYWYAPDRALDALFNGNRRYRRYVGYIKNMCETVGINWDKIQFESVEHHLAHASSAYHLSGFKEKTAIMGIDGKGEYATTFFGYGENGKIHKIKEFYDPDSLGGVYGAMTEYLGFEMLDGEFKVMGMAPYGDPDKYDFSRLISLKESCGGLEFKVNTKLVNVIGTRRYKENGQGFYFSPKLIDWLGPKREGDEIDDPYIDYAASMQKLFEEISLKLMDYYLGDIIKETGKIAFAGGAALNVKLNQKIIARNEVKELFVQPAASDAGTAIGAASYAIAARGIELEKMEHVYLGPEFTNEQCISACETYTTDDGQAVKYEQINEVPKSIAKILADGNPVSWFQGRMEFGPRALGGRSILGCPSIPGVADRINEQIKFRERWRPFCPSMLDTVAPIMLKTDHPAPFMTFTFEVNDGWADRVPEVVHEDGTARAHAVKESVNPRYYALIKEVEVLTGNGVVLNTSLNRRGEPVVCTPEDALNMFYGSDLQYLIMQDILVTKE